DDLRQPRASNRVGVVGEANPLCMRGHFWPGETIALSGIKAAVKSARLLSSQKKVEFRQDRFRVRFTGLPSQAPDAPVTTIAIECDSEPTQDTDFVRREKPRLQA